LIAPRETSALVSRSTLKRPSAAMRKSASLPRFVRGEVAKTTTSTSFVGCRPESRRNAIASSSLLM
jgi:hypothetical protein